MQFEEFMRRFPIALTRQQQEAVRTAEGPVMLLAVPGSGKTTVLVARLGYLIYGQGVAPENILTITYTVAATRDMKHRFAALFGAEAAERLEFRTINGICAKIIAYYSRMIGRKAFDLVTNEAEAAGALSRIYFETEDTWPGEWDLREVRMQITYCKNMMLSEAEIAKTDKAMGIRFSEIYRRYNKWLREHRLMDYDDQMVYACTILKKSEQVRSAFQNRYRFICVDEAQDTSRIQHAVIELLSSGNLFMVGDEDQSIYGFRAAYPQALLEFDKSHKGAKILLMEENFRSRKEIVSIADEFIRSNQLRHEKHMVCGSDVQSGTQMPGGEHPAAETVRYIPLGNRRAQYTYLAKVAADCRTQTAVLMRNNESAVPLVDLLEREGTPYRIKNKEIGFFTHRTVQDLCCYLRLSRDPRDYESFWQIYYKMGIYLSKQDAQAICDLSREKALSVFEAAEKISAGGRYYDTGLSAKTLRNLRSIRTHLKNMRRERGDKAIDRIIKYMGYGDYLQNAGIGDGKVWLLRTIGAREETAGALLDRIGFLKRIFEEKETNSDCPFIISTIHSSKGLEYDTVYLMDVMDGIFPEKVPAQLRKMSREEQETLEEERRLFYVGITRARNRLHLFGTGEDSLFAEELMKHSSLGLREQTKTRGSVTARAKVKNVPVRTADDKEERDSSFDDDGYFRFVLGLGEGLAVRHAKYGEGVITKIGSGRVNILFDDKMRTFSLRVLYKKKLLTEA